MAVQKWGMRYGNAWPMPAEHRHQPADHTAQIGVAAAGQAAVVREGLGEAHADGRPHRGRQAHQECRPGLVGLPCSECRGKKRRQASIRKPSIKPTNPGLNHLKQEELPGRLSLRLLLADRLVGRGRTGRKSPPCRRSSSAKSPRSCRISASLVKAAARV